MKEILEPLRGEPGLQRRLLLFHPTAPTEVSAAFRLMRSLCPPCVCLAAVFRWLVGLGLAACCKWHMAWSTAFSGTSGQL